jgi:hypothetical protein
MRHALIITLLVFLGTSFSGCQPDAQTPVEGNAVLMTVGSQEIKEDEFRRAYRVFRAAYGAEADEPPAMERSAMFRFLQQLTDQLVLMEYARESGVTIAEETLDQAVEAIRSDYPEGLFEQMLLENAVNFEDWREALRVRLTIDRLVQEELTDKVRITEEDIAEHYQNQASGQSMPTTESEADGADQVDQLLVDQLRRQKSENAYGPWIEGIRARYEIEVNQAVVQKIMIDNGLPADHSEDERP